MHLIFRAGMSKKEIGKIKKKMWPNAEAGFNAPKYNGVLKIKGDALAIQKKLRNDWDRAID